MKTSFHTVEDLLADESFLAWYHQTNKTAVQVWNEWMVADAGNKAMATEAITILKQLKVAEKRVTHDQLNAATNRLLSTIKKIST
jgi:hypothetical protein